ncbi:hypothetical protein SY83_22190 [Paenibacillus swuensis]|uniref:Xylose isomerase-like TIM barrel domain-containing protein n=1 Tax=Paenibacillus swuensis TaxID=1178515 RepID=A0A172TNS0_9BACL|nr:sugar phosphate isomerase/epimerase family protein [Paenibacillus swuensis]ANE48544.1 hypothetical protein SY83_22190 [Paenibacillus swuensis]
MSLKLSLCSVGCKTEGLEEIIPKTAAVGFQGVEIWSGHADQYRKRYGELNSLAVMLNQYHVTPTVIAGYSEFVRLEGGQALAALRDHLSPLIEDAVDIGAPYIRLFTDWIPSASYDERQKRRLFEGLRMAGQMAEDAGKTLILETHNDQWTDSTETTLEIIHAAQSPCVRVNLDIYNLYHMGEDPLEALEKLWPHTVNVHLKNGVHAPDGTVSYGVPIGDGEMDFIPVIEVLKSCNYQGYLAVEWFGDSFWESVQAEYDWIAGQVGPVSLVNADKL